ncbi:MAG: hypothetical protein AAGC93_12030 [Cyanobacteria bacterium P01_F01_bin.53]
MMKSIQRGVRLNRRISVTVPVPPAIARENLISALAEPVILSGKYQVTRRYWGNLSHDRLRFHGPRDAYNCQICFFLEGLLHDGNSEGNSGNGSRTGSESDLETMFQGNLYVSRVNVVQTLAAIIIIFTVLGVMMRGAAIPIGLIFTGFIYGMTQWHCQYYSKEITRLVGDLMLKGAPQSQA